MMNITRALSISVSCLSLTAGSVFAYSFSGEYLSAPPPSILSTHEHTPQIRKSPHPQGAASLLLVDGNFQNQLSTVMFGLDPNIQVAKESILDLDPRVKPEDDNSFLVASVCFITDTGECQGIRAGGGSEDKPVNPDVIDPDSVARCKKEGYNLTSCNSVQEPFNRCPYNNSYFEKCVCKSGLVTCTKPQYGVGEACGGKYASCQTDNPRACREDGYTNTCSSGQKLKKSPRCQYDSSFGICCTESCAANTSLTCTGANAGDDGCGYTCKQCCVTSCPSGYSYTESQLTGANGNGWVKDGTDYCDHCTRGKLYKRKAATCSVTQTCSCGGSGQCKSGNNTYYSSCNCCSNCGGYNLTSQTGCSYGYNSCRDQCTGTTYYQCRSCDDSGSSYCPSNYFAIEYTNECGNKRYNCYRLKCQTFVTASESCVLASGGGYWFNKGAPLEKRCVDKNGSYSVEKVYYVAQRSCWQTMAGATEAKCLECVNSGNPYRAGEMFEDWHYI